MEVTQRLMRGEQPYQFETVRDAADYMWRRGILASEEYEAATGMTPPDYVDLEAIEGRLIPLCRTCELPLYYSGEYAAPGYGQAWRCGNGHEFCKLGTRFVTEAPILTPEDVR